MGLRSPSIDIFGAQRRRVQQQQTGQSQEEMDALRRRIAGLGGLDTGSALKIQAQQEEKAGQRMQGALGEVDVAEQQFNLQQQEAEKQRQFQAGESALGRRAAGELQTQALAGQKEITGMQLGGQKEIAGMQIGSAEKMQLNQQDFQKIESSLGRDAAKELAEMGFQNNAEMKAIDAELASKGMLSAEKIANLNANTQTNIAKLDIAYKNAKDQKDRDIIDRQAKNELATYMMAQSTELLQLVASSGGAIKLSDVADMYRQFTQGAYTRDKDGTLIPNSNWDITGLAGVKGVPGATPSTVVNVVNRPGPTGGGRQF